MKPTVKAAQADPVAKSKATRLLDLVLRRPRGVAAVAGLGGTNKLLLVIENLVALNTFLMESVRSLPNHVLPHLVFSYGAAHESLLAVTITTPVHLIRGARLQRLTAVIVVAVAATRAVLLNVLLVAKDNLRGIDTGVDAFRGSAGGRTVKGDDLLNLFPGHSGLQPKKNHSRYQNEEDNDERSDNGCHLFI